MQTCWIYIVAYSTETCKGYLVGECGGKRKYLQKNLCMWNWYDEIFREQCPAEDPKPCSLLVPPLTLLRRLIYRKNSKENDCWVKSKEWYQINQFLNKPGWLLYFRSVRTTDSRGSFLLFSYESMLELWTGMPPISRDYNTRCHCLQVESRIIPPDKLRSIKLIPEGPHCPETEVM